MPTPATYRAAFSSYAVGEETPDGEQRMFCPVCEDPETSRTPSASMNLARDLYNCLKGHPGVGTPAKLVSYLKDDRGFNLRSEALKARNGSAEFSTKRNAAAAQSNKDGARGRRGLPTDDQIKEWSSALLDDKRAIAALMSERGLERQTIVDWELGWNDGRYMIPVRDEAGELLNVRRYKMGATSESKMLNWTGHGGAALFRPDLLAANEEIVITEGEMDCILLNQTGIPAITHTAGASTFRREWGSKFASKTVFVCYDNDQAGMQGALKVVQIIKPFATAVYIVKIPIERKGADVTDFLHLEGNSESDFRGLMAAAQSVGATHQVLGPVPDAGLKVSLATSQFESNADKTLEMVVSVVGKRSEPFGVPKNITVNCDVGKGAVCNVCPISAMSGQGEFELRPDDPALFRFVDVTEQRRKTLMREFTGARCNDRTEYSYEGEHRVESLIVQPSIDERTEDETQTPLRRTVFAIGTTNTAVNEKVRLVGRNALDPKDATVRFAAWRNEPMEVDIDKFELTDDLRARLTIFQPSATQSPLDKALEIASDNAENVTHIYGRDLLHVGYDLVWHSVLSFRVYDKVVDKGWLEMMVVGDTRTGKSEVAQQLLRHYRAGQMLSCEGMSFAGIVGGVQKINDAWHTTWGVVPLNDRRLVVLDEVSGMAEANVIEQMSSVRSSGVAQITKISSEQTSARTRLLWITNPPNQTMDRANGAGVKALKRLISTPEDIARFDFVMATLKDDVSPRVVNTFEQSSQPAYSAELSGALVKWAWSLKRDQIRISPAAADEALKGAMSLGERFISDPPLIQSENVRFKILRLACALAARTFSVSPRENLLLVSAEHVRDAVKFLSAVYDESGMGYAAESRRYYEKLRVAQENIPLVKDMFLREPEIAESLNNMDQAQFKRQDLEIHLGKTREQTAAILNSMVKWNMFVPDRGTFHLSPILQNVLDDVLEE